MPANQIFPHPFSKLYWKTAAREFRDTRTLIFAALMIALRVIFKGISIPIGVDLRINTAFLINAFGAMVYGPVVAMAAAAVTDTLGWLLFPTGPYFFPFIFEEIAGSLLFALFLYRADLTPRRVILSRFCIDFFVNIVLNTPIMMLYYQMMMGRYYAPFDAMRIIKNLVMFPIESVVLILFLRIAIPRVRTLGFTIGSIDRLRFTRRHVAFLCALFLIGATSVGVYSVYAYEHTSLSASYSADERKQHNHEMAEYILQKHPELTENHIVTIVESAYPKAFHDEITYSVAVYQADSEILLVRAQEESLSEKEMLDRLFAYSRSPASKDEALQRLGTAEILVIGNIPDAYQDDLAP